MFPGKVFNFFGLILLQIDGNIYFKLSSIFLVFYMHFDKIAKYFYF